MRLAAYGAISTLVTSGVIMSAFHQRSNFYSACVYLAQSNACLMILTNFGFFLTLMFGMIVQKVLYGPLRATEVEHLYEKAWYAVTETCLAMTIFRDEFDGSFIAMFTALLFLKCFHWLGSDRVDFMEQTPPTNPTLFHTRLSTSLGLLMITDLILTKYCVTTLLSMDKPNMVVMFAFEFAILTISCSCVSGRYILGLIEKGVVNRRVKASRERHKRIFQRRVEAGDAQPEEEEDYLEEVSENEAGAGWEDKGVYIFYLELVADLLKLVTYLMFFAIVMSVYGLPLHIIRDVYLTLRSFITRIRDFIRYRRATAHMNSRYPDATADEVGREGVCIICRDDMTPWVEPENRTASANENRDENEDRLNQRSRPKRLPCGHVLHFACLRSWLERQQRCPTCRRPVLDDALPATDAQPLQRAPAPAGAAQQQQPQGAQPHGAQPAAGAQQQPPAPDAAHPQPPAQPAQRGFGFGPFRIPQDGFIQGFANQLAQRQQAAAAAVAQQQGANRGPAPVVAGPQMWNTGMNVPNSQIMTQLQWLDTMARNQHQLLTQLTNDLRSLREEVGNSSTNRETPTAGGGAGSQTSQNSTSGIAGLTLPAGWSIIPLNPIAQGGSGIQVSIPPQQAAQSSSPNLVNSTSNVSSSGYRPRREIPRTGGPRGERSNPLGQINTATAASLLQSQESDPPLSPSHVAGQIMRGSRGRRLSRTPSGSLNGDNTPERTHSPGDDIEQYINVRRSSGSGNDTPDSSEPIDDALGRSIENERRRSSAGEIPLSETEGVWQSLVSKPRSRQSSGATSPRIPLGSASPTIAATAGRSSRSRGVYNVLSDHSSRSRSPSTNTPPTSRLAVESETLENAVGNGGVNKGKQKASVEDAGEE